MAEVIRVRRQKVWTNNRSRVISLPKWWCDERLNDDYVSVCLTDDGNLLIKPAEEPDPG